MSTATTIQFDCYTITFIAAHFERSVSEIRLAAQRMGVSPCARLNGIECYSPYFFERLSEIHGGTDNHDFTRPSW